ncbi:hypothetical protein EF903_05410 [Streptomyces sp. WAC05292]|uniref:hypothetical protein n=1 Tax=Streptomyces sp. WAC05292 TaxID=2487418 RepID=UPI000F749443|nr:hypothetical protein [Streptomyces sp. WAC05292]RSS95078.1 hypothetical protein EF903_05410 [Streptomyces sp. WAC05292]
MTAGAQCAVHRVADHRGAHTAALPLPPCRGGTEFGVWEEGAGGFVYAADCATEAGNWAVDLFTEDPEAELTVRAICRDHAEQPADVCEECYGDAGDSP